VMDEAVLDVDSAAVISGGLEPLHDHLSAA
jgi:hypothetical protein